MTDENVEIDEYVKRFGGKVNAEKEPEVGPEAPVSDGDVPSLPSSAMGVRSVERIGRKSVQDRRESLTSEAYDAGYNDGFGDGYIDGYDDGQYNQLVGLIRELEDVFPKIMNAYGPDGALGLNWATNILRRRLEHEP